MDSNLTSKKHILPIIVFSQFCCTSLWFAGNGIIGDLASAFDLQSTAVGDLTASVQFGFISGTLLFAFLTIADRYKPSMVFFSSGILASIFNLGVVLESNNLLSLITFRFFTGFFLAGIYPVGMKIAADYYEKGLGKALGFLVGALVIGTAFPHLLKSVTSNLSWKTVLFGTSGLSILGGTLMLLFVPPGPFRKSMQKLDVSAFLSVFKSSNFRAAAFGYFGHMWELYAFWAFIPFIIDYYKNNHGISTLNTSLMSFLIIGIGGLSCVLSGILSLQFDTKKVAGTFLGLSGICCLLSPIVFQFENEYLFLLFLLIWGVVVIGDSPLFSSLVAKNAETQIKGTALTIVNCIGFAITIISIQLLNIAKESLTPKYLFLLLVFGPALGLLALFHTKKKSA